MTDAVAAIGITATEKEMIAVTFADNERRLVNYRLAIALVLNMERTGKLSEESARLLCTKLAEKYGMKSGSIFAP